MEKQDLPRVLKYTYMRFGIDFDETGVWDLHILIIIQGKLISCIVLFVTGTLI